MSSGVQAAHSSHQFHALLHSPHHNQELNKMSPNSEDHIIHALRQPPITSTRQVSRDSEIPQATKALESKDAIVSPAQASVMISPRENAQAYSVISSSNDTLPSLAESSTKIPILAATEVSVVRNEATIPTTQVPTTTFPTISPSIANDGSPSNKRKSPEPSPGSSRRDSLPMGLRNKKMKATDCLLFAATLLEQATPLPVPAAPTAPSVPLLQSVPPTQPLKKNKKPLKKMFCEKVERSMQEAKKKKQQQEEEELEKQQQQEQDSSEDQDCENKPKDADVLCGRGGKVNKHPGNIVYRKVVEYNKSYYQSVHKKHRILVSQSIVRAILNYGGRFMGQKGKEWTPICFKRAVQKTSQALRERSNTSEPVGDFAPAGKHLIDAAVPKD